ncbi:MAG: caspase family protein [Spirochaetes bacterium]|nr:caspase family protein [Spirochaetota bacterium]
MDSNTRLAQATRSPFLPRLSLFASLLVVLSSLLSGEPAPTRRYALVIGENDGGPKRVKLRYAVSDARTVAGVLTSLGGVRAEDLVLLADPDRESVERAFVALGERIRAEAGTDGRSETIFYYSGHSDDEGLCLGREKIGYGDLRAQIRQLPSGVKVAVLDSCASGVFTRTKGGKQQAPFLVDNASRMEGHAFLTSSSVDEAAQESDRIGGSFFTHYLVTGLRGAADANRDGKVTLNESYDYAFRETLAGTEQSRGGPQHPGYDIQLSGTGDLVLTDTRSTSCTLAFPAELAGRVTVRGADGNLVAEFRKAAGRATSLGMEPGSYRILVDGPQGPKMTILILAKGESAALDPATLVSVNREQTVSRGGKSAESFLDPDRMASMSNMAGLSEGTEAEKDPLAMAGVRENPADPGKEKIKPFEAASISFRDAFAKASAEMRANLARATAEMRANISNASAEIRLNRAPTPSLAKKPPIARPKEKEISPARDPEVGTGMDLSTPPKAAAPSRAEKKPAPVRAHADLAIEPFSFGIVPGVQFPLRGAGGVRTVIGLNLIAGATEAVAGYYSSPVFSVVTGRADGFVSSGAFTKIGAGAGLLASGGASVVAGDYDGLACAGGVTILTGSGKGLFTSGGATILKSLDGLLASGGVNIVYGAGNGLAAAGGANIVSGDFNGLIAAGGVNIVAGALNGLATAGGVNISGSFRGMETAVVNITGRGAGAQVGVVNIAGDLSGCQIGVINVAKSMKGVGIGLLNFIGNGIQSPEIAYNEQNMVDLAFKLGSPYFYTFLSLGVSGAVKDRITGTENGAAVHTTEWFVDRVAPGAGFGFHIPGKRLFVDLVTSGAAVMPDLSAASWNASQNFWARQEVLVGFSFFRHLSLVAGVSYNLLLDRNDPFLVAHPMGASSPDLAFKWSTPQAKQWLGFKAGVRF